MNSPEPETWKSMVDSVIEFISASRAMLHILNDKLVDAEHRMLFESRKKDDEQIKERFYKEYLSLNIESEYTTKQISANLSKESRMLKYKSDDCPTRSISVKSSYVTKNMGCQASGYRSVRCGESGNISNVNNVPSKKIENVSTEVNETTQVKDYDGGIKKGIRARKKSRSRSRAKTNTEKNIATEKAQVEKGAHIEGQNGIRYSTKRLQTKEKSYSLIHRNKLTAIGDTK